MARNAHTSTSRCITYLWIHHSNMLEKKNTGITSSHSQVAPWRRETHQAMTRQPDGVDHPDVHGAAVERMDLRLVLGPELELALGRIVAVDEFCHGGLPISKG